MLDNNPKQPPERGEGREMSNKPTTAQLLELLAEYAALAAEEYALSVANPHDPLSHRRGERQTKGERHDVVALRLLEVQRRLRSLDPTTLRAQAEALAEQQREVERLRIALITAADLLHDCWNQWAFNTSSGKYDGGLSTLEDLDEILFDAGVIDSKGNYITGSIPSSSFKMSELGLIVRQVLKAPTQEAQE